LALGRSPSAAELNGWLAANLDRTTLAMTILTSSESLADIVQRSYQTIFGRAPSSSEIAAWVGPMQSGLSFGGFIEDLLDSAEFNNRVG
jgi:hypothetical protein